MWCKILQTIFNAYRSTVICHCNPIVFAELAFVTSGTKQLMKPKLQGCYHSRAQEKFHNGNVSALNVQAPKSVLACLDIDRASSSVLNKQFKNDIRKLEALFKQRWMLKEKGREK